VKAARRDIGPARTRRALCGALAALLVGACAEKPATREPQAAKPRAEPARISWTHFEVPQPPPTTPELLASGKEIYAKSCAACHGETGAGDGRCAPFITPQPRDFTSGVFRFKTTPGGAAPTDADLFRTVSLGLHATGMPPWRYLLSDEERWAAVAYVKSLAPGLAGQGEAKPVDLANEPKQVAPDGVAAGRKLYEENGCAKCHGERGYGDGPSAETLEDSFGHPIAPRNFHKASDFKRGHTLRDVALTIATGNNGTPMPAFDALPPDQLWNLAAYVLSLAEKRYDATSGKSAVSSGDEHGEPDVVVRLVERSWQYAPSEIRVKQGQVVRIEFQPTDNGLGAGHGFALDGYDRSVFINGAMVQRPKSVTFVADKPGTFTFYCATQCSTGSLHPNMKGKLVVEPSRAEGA
jgi:mono/diheme cytochrome c family protein